jgi:hypothetical protein
MVFVEQPNMSEPLPAMAQPPQVQPPPAPNSNGGNGGGNNGGRPPPIQQQPPPPGGPLGPAAPSIIGNSKGGRYNNVDKAAEVNGGRSRVNGNVKMANGAASRR